MSETLKTVCPHCATINQLPSDKLDQSPSCGRCGEAIYNGKPVALDDATLARHVRNSEQPLLVDFWADWCGPCKMMAPHFATAAGQLEPHIRLAKVDTEQARNSAAQFNIRSIPTMILFSGGKEIARQSGAMQAPQIVQWVQSQLA